MALVCDSFPLAFTKAMTLTALLRSSMNLQLQPSGVTSIGNIYCKKNFSRFGHSLIRPNMTLLTEDEARAGWVEGSKKARQVPLREVFHNPALLFQGQRHCDVSHDANGPGDVS